MRGWNNPYRDVTVDQWKNDEAVSIEYVKRVMKGEEPILSHFLYEAENEIRNLAWEAHDYLFHPEYKIDKTKAEKLIEQYARLLKPDFPEQTSFLPIKKNIPVEKYFELYKKLCDKEPPFPESICVRILCIGTLRGSVLGSEKKSKLVYNRD